LRRVIIMAYDYQAMRRLPVDPRVIDKIQRSPSMSYEQGSDFMSGFGGPQQYKQFAKLPTGQRLTYAAVLEGHTEPIDISVVTGLTPEEVDAALTKLERRGLVTVQEAQL